MTLSACDIRATWNEREETPTALGARFAGLIDRLAPLHPAFGNWLWVEKTDTPRRFDDVRRNLTLAVANKMVRDDWGDPEPCSGYSLSVVNTYGPTVPTSLSVGAHCGCTIKQRAANFAMIETGWRIGPDPTIVTFDVWKPALLALAESFDADYCDAYPSNIFDLWHDNPRFKPAWMAYVSPAFAPLIAPPPTALVERRPNGGLLMAAADETFRIDEPRHLSVAYDILKALAPLEALPD